MIKVLLADDLPMFTEGLGLLLSNDPGIQLIGTAANGIDVLAQLPEVMPEVLVTDIQMPEMDGIELTKEIKRYYPSIHVIGLTMFKEDHLIVEMLEAGAKGYVLKTSHREQLVTAIQAVHAGGLYFCDHTSLKLSKMIGRSKMEGFRPPAPDLFNAAEIQIIQLICREFSSKEIGEALHLGLRTIEAYRHKIFEKTGAKNMAGVVIYAIKTGLFPI
ncbi:MAG: response regulator transcription factor [Sphingobacteriales bacterium]|nr:MAG: response regulator transcription factor [Sphingobacteriales bacterium]